MAEAMLIEEHQAMIIRLDDKSDQNRGGVMIKIRKNLGQMGDASKKVPISIWEFGNPEEGLDFSKLSGL